MYKIRSLVAGCYSIFYEENQQQENHNLQESDLGRYCDLVGGGGDY